MSTTRSEQVRAERDRESENYENQDKGKDSGSDREKAVDSSRQQEACETIYCVTIITHLSSIASTTKPWSDTQRHKINHDTVPKLGCCRRRVSTSRSSYRFYFFWLQDQLVLIRTYPPCNIRPKHSSNLTHRALLRRIASNVAERHLSSKQAWDFVTKFILYCKPSS